MQERKSIQLALECKATLCKVPNIYLFLPFYLFMGVSQEVINIV